MSGVHRIAARVAASDQDTRRFCVAYAIVLPFFWVPLFVTPFLPGLDLPFHLSMADMLSKAHHAQSPYAPFYQSTLGLKPYAAHYLLLVALGSVMSLATAQVIIVMLYVAAFPLAVAAWLAACGKSRLPALFAFPLAYNLTFHYGFFSFSLALPVLALLLAAVARFLAASAPSRAAWAVTAAAAFVLYLCHLQNFLFGVAAAGSLILFARASWKRRARAALALGPALLALVVWQRASRFVDDPTDQRRTLGFALDNLKHQRLLDLGHKTLFADFWERTQALVAQVLRGFVDLSDERACRTLFVLLGVYALLGIAATFAARDHDADPARDATSPRPRFRLALVVIFLGAAVAYYGLPHHLPAFELMTFFPRFSVLLVLTALPLLPSALRRVRGLAGWLLIVPVVALCLDYGDVLTEHYRQYGHEVSDFQAVLKAAKPGKKALGLVFDRRSRVMRIESAFLGLPEYYAAAKPAPTSMGVVQYCTLRHMPCKLVPGNPPLPAPDVWLPTAFDPDTSVPFFDYFFVRSPPSIAQLWKNQAAHVILVAQKGTWWLYQRTGI